MIETVDAASLRAGQPRQLLLRACPILYPRRGVRLNAPGFCVTTWLQNVMQAAPWLAGWLAYTRTETL